MKILIAFLGLLIVDKIYSQANNSLVFPNDNYFISENATIFTWNKDTNSVSFEVFISTNSLFNDTIYRSGLLINPYDSTLSLAKGNYYWRVRTNYIGGNYLFSNVRKFSIFTPNNISNLGLWLKSNQGLTFNASKIIKWSDQSGNLNDAVQVDTNLSPVVSSTSLNGYNPIQYDGVNDYLLLKDSLENPFELYFLLDVTSVSVSSSIFSDINHTNGTIYYFPPNKIALWRGSQVVFTPFTSGTNFYHISHEDTALKILKNNIPMTLSSSGPINNIKIKRIGASTSTPFPGKIYEIIGFNGNITANETDSINNYLRYKYAPPINLGANIYRNNYCDTILFAKKGWFTSYLWQDGSTADSLIVNKTGYYSCTVTDIFGFSSTDSIYIEFPIINTSLDTAFCLNDSLVWNTNLNKTDFTFLWNNSSTDSLLNIKQSGNYWVKVTDNKGCIQYSDTLTIAVDSFSVQTSLGADKTICQGAYLELLTGNNSYTFIWNTGDTTTQIKIDTASQYWVKVTNSIGCIAKDTIQITLNGIAPTVGFDAPVLCSNEQVLFNDTSFTSDGSNIISWSWVFGDGDTSNIQNPQHFYSTPSSYIVTLSIATDSGCFNSTSNTLQIHQAPAAGFFTTTNPICSGLPVNFTDNSFSNDGTFTNWQWNFGDTSSVDTSTVQNASYIFALSNIYTTQLIVSTNYNCKDTVSNSVIVKPSPIASFLYNDSCVNNNIPFVNTSQGNIANTNWNFGDANTSNLSNPTHVYSSIGTYNVDLIASSTNGCYDSTRQLVTIYDNPTAYFVTNDFCVLAPHQFYDSSSTTIGSITNWSWNVEGNANQSTNQNPVFSFNNADTGLFFVDLIVTSNVGCTDSIQDTINVYPLPVPQFTFTPTIGAPPLTVSFTNQTAGNNSYLWNFGDNNTSTLTSPTHIYNDSNIFDIHLIVTSSFGCIDSANQTIKVIRPVLDVAVVNVSYNFLSNTNFLKISAKLVNYGAYDITSLNILASTSSSGSIMENWSGNLNVGNLMDYQFTSSFEILNGEVPDLICVKALNPNGSVDEVPSNNEFCITLDKFILISLYPNPVSKTINLAYLTPTSGTVKIKLNNALGQQITEFYSDKVTKGLNKQQFDLSIYSSGIYFISIEFGDKLIKEKIIIR